jgi:ammonium transporter, Amt family
MQLNISRTFQWTFWGYSLAYSDTASSFIGNMDKFGLRGVMSVPSGDLPEITFCLYQLMFCIVTVMILVGGTFERGRIIPTLVFAWCWATIVYCPIACWTWNANGWLYNLPSLDYAGGGPVHIASGCGALAYAIALGPRKSFQSKTHLDKPHNISLVFIGTILIFFGWFGFNGGSTLNSTVRSYLAAYNTNMAASCGIIGWVIVDMIRTKGKFSAAGACEGAIAGLVGITPAAGYVQIWLAGLIGLLTGAACASLHNLNRWIRVDEGLDVFKLHGVGGMIGSFLTGIFATSSISLLDGATEAPGAIDGVGVQVGRQLADITAVASYSFVVSLILAFALKFIGKFIPMMDIRIHEQGEIEGLDIHEFFEEEVGDWSISAQHPHGPTYHGHTTDGNKMSAPSSPPNESVDTKTETELPRSAV